MNKRRYIIQAQDKQLALLYTEKIAYALAELENAEVIVIIN